MVPLPYSVPAIEQTVVQDVDEAYHRTGGVQTKSGAIADIAEVFTQSFTVTPGDEKGSYKDSTQPPVAKTGVVESHVTELHLKPTERARPQQENHTIGFSQFVFRQKTIEMASLLESLKHNLERPEGAAIMTAFRNSLEQLWRIAGPLPKERVLVVSAVEEAVRQKKWRELSVGQIMTLQRLLTKVSLSEADSRMLDSAFSALHRSRIDIYPSATVDEDDADTEADPAEE